jgi:hypothetical protein
MSKPKKIDLNLQFGDQYVKTYQLILQKISFSTKFSTQFQEAIKDIEITGEYTFKEVPILLYNLVIYARIIQKYDISSILCTDGTLGDAFNILLEKTNNDTMDKIIKRIKGSIMDTLIYQYRNKDKITENENEELKLIEAKKVKEVKKIEEKNAESNDPKKVATTLFGLMSNITSAFNNTQTLIIGVLGMSSFFPDIDSKTIQIKTLALQVAIVAISAVGLYAYGKKQFKWIIPIVSYNLRLPITLITSFPAIIQVSLYIKDNISISSIFQTIDPLSFKYFINDSNNDFKKNDFTTNKASLVMNALIYEKIPFKTYKDMTTKSIKLLKLKPDRYEKINKILDGSI